MCTKVQLEDDAQPGQLVPANALNEGVVTAASLPAVLQATATAITIVAPTASIPPRPGTGRRESRWPPQHMHYPSANGISHPFYNRIGRAVHGIPSVGDPDYDAACLTCNPMLINETSVQITYTDEFIGPGIRTGLAVVFVIGEMSGIGVLLTPWASINLGLIGIILLIVFGISTSYSSSCLGTCWFILEERYQECRQEVCVDPYPKIAYYACGKKTSYLTTGCIQATLFGAATVYLMLIAQCAEKLFEGSHPEISFCTWLFVFSIAISSLMILETPKNYFLVAVGTLLTTMAGCYFIILQMLLDERKHEGIHEIETTINDISITQYYLSMGTILFCYGGAAAFPTIQNNMLKRNEYSHTIISSFMMLAVLFASIVFGGYMIYGNEMNPNMLMTLGNTWMAYVAIILVTAQLIVGFLIIVNPVSRFFENHIMDIVSTNDRINGFQRFGIRVSLLLAMILLAESVSDLNNLVAFIGSTTVTITTFVLPSIFYLNLTSMKSQNWPDRSSSLPTKVYMFTVIVVGVIGSIIATIIAIINSIGLSSYLEPINAELFSYLTPQIK